MSELQIILDEVRAIRREQVEQGKLVAAIDERTKTTKESIEKHLEDDKAFHDDMDKRVDSLEHTRTKLMAKVTSYAAAIGFVVAFIGDVAKDWLTGWFGRG